MFDILLVSCDARLISAIDLASKKLGLDLSVRPDPHKAAALLTRRKMYAMLADDAGGVAVLAGAIPFVLFVVVCTIVVLMYVRVGKLATDVHSGMQVLQDQRAVLLAQAGAPPLLQTVAASRESFRALIDSFAMPVCTLSLDGKVRTANRRFMEIVGRSFPQLIGASIFDLIIEPSAKSLEADLPRFLEARNWSGTVRVCIEKTREWRYFECSVQPALEDGHLAAVTLVANDVTALPPEANLTTWALGYGGAHE